MWFKKKSEEKVKKQYNVKKAVASVTMLSGRERTITRIGKVSMYNTQWEHIVTGSNELYNLFEEKYTILCDDSGKWFAVAQIAEINIKEEDYFIQE